MAARRAVAAKYQRNNLRNNVFVQHNPSLYNFYNTLPFRAFATKTIPVPGMGDSISSGVVEEFVKGPGDFVEADEIVARIETDKVTVDIASPEAGVIKEYMAAEGDTVDVGADFYILDTDAKGAAGGAAPAAPKAAAPEPTPAATPAPAAQPAPAAAKTPTPPPPPPRAAPAQAPTGGAPQ